MTLYSFLVLAFASVGLIVTTGIFIIGFLVVVMFVQDK